MQQQQFKMISTKEDHTVAEVVSTLKEWHQIWISLYLEKQTTLFDSITKEICHLIELKQQIIDLLRYHTQLETDSATVNSRYQKIFELRATIARKLDHGNKLLNLDLVPRDANFELIEPAKLSPIRLHQLHIDAPESNPGDFDVGLASGTNNRYSSPKSSRSCEPIVTKKYSKQKSAHIQLSLTSYNLLVSAPEELFELYLTIIEVNKSAVKAISDRFTIRLRGDENIYGFANTIFTNIGELGDRELYLQVQAYRIGSMTINELSKNSIKQQSASNIHGSNASQDGSNQSINNANKYAPNGLSKCTSQITAAQCQTYKRPFGVALLSLSDLLKQKETESCIKIFACGELDFPVMNDIILRKQNAFKNNPNTPHLNLFLNLKVLVCNDDSISKFCASQQFCKTEKRGFPDIVMPGDCKNDLYLGLEYGEFEKGGKSIPKNIEASISLIDRAGIAIQNCIFTGSNCDLLTCYKSSIFYHLNSPKWNEDIKIKVPLSEFDKAHIRIEFRHCSTREKEKKFLGFSFLPLSDEDGAVVSDKQHELYLYKCDSQIWEDESLNLCSYTSSPFGPDCRTNRSNSTSNHFTHSNKELIAVSTFLLSTKLTQNRNLLSLLKWRELVKKGNNEIEEALLKVLTLDGEEIVKFLQDILDTLFDTFTLYSVSDDPKRNYSALIFKVLVHVFTLLDEPKYKHFQQVLDSYVSAHFSATLVYRGLLLCLKKCVDHASNVEKHPPIQKCFRSMRFIFQFVVQSRLLYLKATGEQNDMSFSNDLRFLFKSFEQLLAETNPDLLPIQKTILESFPGTYCHLTKVMTVQELIRVVNTIVKTVGLCILPESLLKAKLIFMNETAKSEIMKNQEARVMVIEMFCPHLDYHMRKPEEPELCQSILRELVDKMHEFHWPSLYWLFELTRKHRVDVSMAPLMTAGGIRAYIGSNERYTQGVEPSSQQAHFCQVERIMSSLSKELEPMMPIVDLQVRLLEQAAKDSNFDKVLLQKYCTNLLTILKLMSEQNYQQYEKRVDYFKFCDLSRVFRGVFNRDWSTMQLTATSILEHSLRELSKLLLSEIKTQNHTINQLSSYFNLVVDFITHPALQLETFSLRKRNNILNLFGDLRIKFGHQMLDTWESLTPTNIYALLPTFVQSFLNVALLPIDEMQKKIIATFYDMMESEYEYQLKSEYEYQHKLEFGQLSRCFIDNIEVFMNLERGNANFIQNFSTVLTAIINQRSPDWKDRGLQLVKSLEKLMIYLMEYQQSLSVLESSSRRMNSLVDLLNFYKHDHDRPDLHAKYIFKLSQMHIDAVNHVEAAMTLKLYSDTLDWCSRSLSPLDEYQPEEPEWRRKEAIYHKIIQYFDLGKCWEEAIDLCKDLAFFYESWLVDFEKLSSILKTLARFFDNILTQIRPEREYFRVEFVGMGCPAFLRNKDFVFRGLEYERLPEFMQRILNEFADAKMLNPKSRLTTSKDDPGQYVVISNVRPKPCLNDNFKLGQRHSDKVIQYYLNNRIDMFSYDKPLVKGNDSGNKDKGKQNELKSRWVERTMLKLPEQMPNILPWGEICERETIEISPINHAIETISSMNLEMSKLILSYKNDQKRQISPLTMRLQGVIEAAVNGGSALIISTFLKGPSPKSSNAMEMQDGSCMGGNNGELDDSADSIVKLKELIKQQFSILETGLALHAKLAPPEVLPLHARLEERLKATKRTLLEDDSGATATVSNGKPNVTPFGVRITNNCEYETLLRTDSLDTVDSARIYRKNLIDL